MSNKNIDVIILSWDRAEDTKKAIISALEQKRVIVNIYVVDQGSKPECISDIEQFIGQFDNVYLKKNEFNTGVPGGRNQASSMGNGNFIVSLDNDAEFLSDLELFKVIEAFEFRHNTAVIAFNIKRFGTDKNDETSWSYGKSSSEWANKNFLTTRFVGAGHAIKRDLFEKVRGYDDKLFFLHEEVDLSRRFINLGHQIEYITNIGVGHKVSNENRVSWNTGRWIFHARNKTYLNLKMRMPIVNFIFHTLLLQVDGIKKGYFLDTAKAILSGFEMYKINKHTFNEEECLFNEKSERYYRKYTPGADGNVFDRILLRIKEVFK